MGEADAIVVSVQTTLFVWGGSVSARIHVDRSATDVSQPLCHLPEPFRDNVVSVYYRQYERFGTSRRKLSRARRAWNAWDAGRTDSNEFRDEREISFKRG